MEKTFLKNKPGSFLGNRKGVGSVEFALIVPVLLILYIVGVQVTIALTVSRKVNHVASSVGNILTQSRSIAASDIDSILKVSSSFLSPYDETPYSIIVNGVRIGENGSAMSEWSRAYGQPLQNTGTSFQLPSDFEAEVGAFVVVTRTFYDYVPVANFGPIGPFELSGTAYHQPRIGSVVSCAGC